MDRGSKNSKSESEFVPNPIFDNKLSEIVRLYPKVWENERQIKALLMDFYPDDPMKRNLLYLCVVEKIPHELNYMKECGLKDYYKFTKRLVHAYGCSDSIANEILLLWIGALNLPLRNRIEDDANEKDHQGRKKCDLLRKIRQLIAEANDISFEPAKCHHTGPCLGTCPVCDEEIRYLDEELQKKKTRGEEIVLTGLAIDEIKQSECYPNPDVLKEKEESGFGWIRHPGEEYNEELPFN